MLKQILEIRAWIERYERFNPLVFFFGGFTWDSVTLKRIDQLPDNLVLLLYIVGFGILMSITLLVDKKKLQHAFVIKHQQWFPLVLQFFLGGLFSAYVIFYFQSASLSKTALFFAVMVGLLIANEFLQKKLKNLYLLLTLYFLATFSFFIFFIPVILKVLNVFTFIAGGLLSLGLVAGLIFFLHKNDIFDSHKHFVRSVSVMAGMYCLMNLLYFFNWIPPVPLSLKSGGIYHHVSHDLEADKFVLRFEQPKWYQLLKSSDQTFRYTTGDTVSCFTAVFAPTELKKKIFHHWQKYVPKKDEWISTDKLGFNITGYRDGGYRGITRKRNVADGAWRVDVETEEGTLLGRIDFEIETVGEPVELKTIFR